MINVCYAVDAQFLGGAERYVSLLACHLDRSRFRPSVVMRTPDDPHSSLLDWKRQLESENIPVRSVPMNLPFAPLHALAIHRAIADFSPHVVHVNLPGPHDGQMGLLAALSRMAGALGVVVTEHLPMVETPWKRLAVKKFSHRWVDLVLTVCAANVPYLTGTQHVRAEKISVVHNALGRDYGTGGVFDRVSVRKNYGLPAGETLVLFIGNLLIHKGLHRVVRALYETPEPVWHLAVIGEGPEEAAARALIEEKDLGQRVTFLGRLPGSEVEKLLRSADVLTLPSEIEGLPYVILEAMACGLPVVATDVFGIPEMVVDGETGLLVAPGDVPALGRAINELARDGELRGVFGRAARKRFEDHFTMEHLAAVVENVYLTLARGGAAVIGGRP